MQKKLNEFSVGEKGVVLAPLGDPLEITVRGYELTLRKAEASCVCMEVKNA